MTISEELAAGLKPRNNQTLATITTPSNNEGRFNELNEKFMIPYCDVM